MLITNRYGNFVKLFSKNNNCFSSPRSLIARYIIQPPPPREKFPRIILILAFSSLSWFSESVMADCVCCVHPSDAMLRGRGPQLPGQQRLIDRLSPPPPPAQPPPPPHPSSRRGTGAPLAQAGAALMNVYVFPDQRNGQYYIILYENSIIYSDLFQ